MRKTLASTTDVARMFGVTETTVKRWADESTLKCMKTPGGHRKFEIKELVQFAEKFNFEPSGALALADEEIAVKTIRLATLSRDFGALKDVYLEKVLCPEKSDLYQYFSYLYLHRIRLWEIYDLVIRPGMEEIGRRWTEGGLDISREHMASSATMAALARLQTQIRIKPPANLDAVFACPGEEQHEIGLLCASYVFESEGWNPVYLGASVPHASIRSIAEEINPRVVCLSMTIDHATEEDRGRMNDLLYSLRDMKTTVLLGGSAAVRNPKLAGPGISIFASSLELLALIKRINS